MNEEVMKIRMIMNGVYVIRSDGY